jgi:hypothetical protein
MTMINQESIAGGNRAAAPHVRMKMLLQMAAALEDEAGGLYRRAAAFEEEEFLLNPEIEDRQTEVSRLQLKLEALRSTRNGLIEKIEALRSEANAMREEVFNNEEELALSSPKNPMTEGWNDTGCDLEIQSSVFFQRMNL